MVATSALTARMDRHIASVTDYVDDLPGLLEDWNDLPEGPQVSESLRWSHYVADYLTELDVQYRAGEMLPEQQERYRDLLCKLKDALPIIDQLGFWRPQVSLDALPMIVATSTVIARMNRLMTALLTRIEGLPSEYDTWDKLDEHAQIVAKFTWEHLMVSVLTELDGQYRAGEMPPEQQERYRALLCKLKAALPVIDQLGFWRPQVSLEP